MSLDPHGDWWRGMSPREFWLTFCRFAAETGGGGWISVPPGYLSRRTAPGFDAPGLRDTESKLGDLLAESLDILYSQLEAQIVTSRLNPENVAIETWTECDETSFRVCARFVPRKELT